MNEGLKDLSKVPDDVIRRFLLGQLGGAEQRAFEEWLMIDAGLEERVRLAETELSDDYVLERLTRAERLLFEQRFMLSAGRLRKLRVSEVLRDRFGAMPVARPGQLGAGRFGF